jgi:hypothetical protein
MSAPSYGSTSSGPFTGILYYAVRNHIIDFLVSRSRNFVETVTDFDPRNVPLVRPGFVEPATPVRPPWTVAHADR